MDDEVKKIGYSVGIIFPKSIQMRVGDKFTLRTFNNAYVLTPKTAARYSSDGFLGDVRNEMTTEDSEWDDFDSLVLEEADYFM